MPASPVRVEPLAGPADLDAVIAIEDASFHNPTGRAWYEAELARPDVCRIYVIRTADGVVAGFIAFWRVVDEMHINNLAIHPDHRQRGLGRVLLDGALASAAREGVRRATLEVRRSNLAALRLYEGAGFIVAGVRPSYYAGPVEDALLLSAAVESP
ncbi:MAG TPA: ribosomal protein S18-alanine N-acetyltransferase [Vicinamibacterales bacterium]|nr:ribosomal protein S18-alanine N-acetyltransferase [Vicinamibacterales bacterium]